MSAKVIIMKKLALIAGQGQLPVFIASYAREANLPLEVIRLENLGDEALLAFNPASYFLTQIGTIISHLKDRDIGHIILAGKIHRDGLMGGPIDELSAELMKKTLPLGDDAALKAILALLNQEGIQLVPTSMFLPDHQVPEGFDNEAHQNDVDHIISNAIEAHTTFGQLDIGQALILQDSRILSIEGAEGTDALIERTAPFIDTAMENRLFFKAAKSGQNKLLDPPVIGDMTIKQCAKAGINIIAIEAEHCLLALPKDEIDALCKSLGIRLISVKMPE